MATSQGQRVSARSSSVRHLPGEAIYAAAETSQELSSRALDMRNTGQRFVYPKLEGHQIRLLELQPEPYEADLHGAIHVFTLPQHEAAGSPDDRDLSPSSDGSSSNAPTVYQALSHVWGTGGTETTIKIITNNTTREIAIRHSLVPALKTLRRKIQATDASTRFFWIDAICIDQQDPDDKSNQIPRMADIYSGAVRVCVWLGDESKTSRQAIQFIERLRRLEGFDELLLDKDLSPQWSAFFELTWRPWFNRRWIVQEIAVAREAVLLCGNDTVKWDEFADAVSLFASRTEYIRQLFNALEEFKYHPDAVGEVRESGANRLVEATNAILRKKDDGTISEHMLSLEALITTLTGFSASDPHDDIFAVLWLSNDGVEGRKEFALQHTKAVNTPLPSRTASPERLRTHQHTDAPRSQNHDSRSVENPSEANGDSSKADVSNLLVDRTESSSALGVAAVSSSNQATPSSQDVSSHGGAPSASNPWSEDSSAADGSQNAKSSLPEGTEKLTHDVQTTESSADNNDTQSSSNGSNWANMLTKAIETKAVPDINNTRPRRPSLTVPPYQDGGALTKQRTLSPIRRYPKVDYTKPLFEVYKEFLEFAVAGSKSLDIICFPWVPTFKIIEDWRKRKEKTDRVQIEPEPRLPSWMQDKSGASFSLTQMGKGQMYRRVKADPLVGRPGAASRNYLACGKTRAHCRIEGRTLIARGQVFGRVGHVDLPAQSGNVPSSWLETVNWPDPSSPLPNNFWRTLVADRGLDGRLYPRAYYKLACIWAFEQRTEGGDLNTNELMKHGNCNSIAKEFLRRVQAVIFQRHLITVEGDETLIGLAPLHARVGDMIAILEGCSVPVLLRRENLRGKGRAADRDGSGSSVRRGRPNGLLGQNGPELSLTNDHNETENIDNRLAAGDVVEGNQYKFLGECYIHAMMAGKHGNIWRRNSSPGSYLS